MFLKKKNFWGHNLWTIENKRCGLFDPLPRLINLIRHCIRCLPARWSVAIVLIAVQAEHEPQQPAIQTTMSTMTTMELNLWTGAQFVLMATKKMMEAPRSARITNVISHWSTMMIFFAMPKTMAKYCIVKSSKCYDSKLRLVVIHPIKLLGNFIRNLGWPLICQC